MVDFPKLSRNKAKMGAHPINQKRRLGIPYEILKNDPLAKERIDSYYLGFFVGHKKPILVDLFSGCGGFGLGGELAGFHSEVAIDIDETLQSAYKLNFPKTRCLNRDLSKMDSDAWRFILKDLKVDGVIGGPPCQGYSRLGHSNPADERRTLLYHFFRNVNLISPKFFIMENVEGLLDQKNRYELDNAIKAVDEKYTVLEPFVVDASKYGAPTRRRRVIVIGYDKKRMTPISQADFNAPNLSVNVREAISDLPAPIPQNKDKNDFGWSKYRRKKSVSEYAEKMRLPPPDGLGSEEALKYFKQRMSSGHFETRHSEKVAKRYKETLPGKVDKPTKSKKLEWTGIAPTLRAGTGSDKGSFQAVRPLHPKVPRVITVREAARLQGFPDWFQFHNTKWHSFRMIGNSVSPIVSKAIMAAIFSKVAGQQFCPQTKQN